MTDVEQKGNVWRPLPGERQQMFGMYVLQALLTAEEVEADAAVRDYELIGHFTVQVANAANHFSVLRAVNPETQLQPAQSLADPPSVKLGNAAVRGSECGAVFVVPDPVMESLGSLNRAWLGGERSLEEAHKQWDRREALAAQIRRVTPSDPFTPAETTMSRNIIGRPKLRTVQQLCTVAVDQDGVATLTNKSPDGTEVQVFE